MQIPIKIFRPTKLGFPVLHTNIMLVFVLWITPSAASAQSISGVVVGENEVPIVNANVYVPDYRIGVETHENGRFMLEELPSSIITFSVSFVGYRVETRTVDLSDGDVELRIVLSAYTVLGPEVVVEATSETGDLSVSSRSVAILTANALSERRGQTLAELLEEVPGIHIMKMGPAVAHPVIRGLFGVRVPILLDGEPVADQSWDTNAGPPIDPFFAERIEVIKGPAGLEYGMGAMGGIVRIQHRPLPDEPGTGGRLEINSFSNNGQGAGALSLERGSTILPGFGWRLQGGIRKAGDMRTRDYVVGNTAFQETAGQAIVGYTAGAFSVEGTASLLRNEHGVFAQLCAGSGVVHQWGNGIGMAAAGRTRMVFRRYTIWNRSI